MTLQSNNAQTQNSDKDGQTAIHLTTEQAAEYITSKGLRITKGQLANLRHFKKGPAYIKFNGYIYYTAEDLDAWLTKEVRRISPEG